MSRKPFAVAGQLGNLTAKCPHNTTSAWEANRFFESEPLTDAEIIDNI